MMYYSNLIGRALTKTASLAINARTTFSTTLGSLPAHIYYLRHLRRCDTSCWFIGVGRSGSTLIGALLNTHPEIAMAHEMFFWNKVAYNQKIGRQATLANLAQEAAITHDSLAQNGYDYVINFQNNNKQRIKVVGDKSAAYTADAIVSAGGLESLRQLNARWHLNSHFISVVRNPYDVITTRCLRDLKTDASQTKTTDLIQVLTSDNQLEQAQTLLPQIIALFDKRNHAVSLLNQTNRYPLQFVHYEKLTTNPKPMLQNLTKFLGVGCSDDYLEACASIVKPASKTRHLLEQFWTAENQNAVQTIINKYHWLQHYTFAD